METLWRSKPDGQTIGIIDLNGLTVAQHAGRTSIDMRKFTWLGVVQTTSLNIWVAADSPFKSLEDLIQAAKTQPIRGGTTSLTSSLWQSAAVFAAEAGINIEPVAGYKSGGELLVALEAGDFDMVHMVTAAFLPGVKSGSVRALAIAGPSRDPRLPDVPTLIELGFPKTGTFAVSTRSIAAPPDTPPEIATFLEKALMDTMRDQEFLDWVESLGEVIEPLNAKQTFEVAQKTAEVAIEFIPILKQYME